MSWATAGWANESWTVIGETGGIQPLGGFLTVLRTIPNKLDDWLSCRDYGFHPSKTAAENSAAWNNLISEAQGKVIIIPPGVYHHNGLVIDRDDITVTSWANMGPAAIVELVCDNPNVDALQITNCSRTRLSGMTIRHGVASQAEMAAIHASGYTDLHLDHLSTSNWTTTGSYHGLVLNASTSREGYLADLQHCQFVSHAGYGVVLSGLAPTRRVGETTLSHCLIQANQTGGLIVLDYVFGVYVREQCNFGIENERNIILAPSAPGRSLDVFISDCILDASRKQAILADNISSLHLHNNWIASAGATSGETVEAWGIQFLQNVSVAHIVGNYIAFNRTGGVHSSGQHVLLAGNYFNTNGQAAAGVGIELTGLSTLHSLSGNRFIGHSTNVLNNGSQNDVGVEHRSGNTRPISPGGMEFGDSDFFAALVLSQPTLAWAPNDYLRYDRDADTLQVVIGNIAALMVGFLSGNPFFSFDTNDYLRYDRAADYLELVTGSVGGVRLGRTGDQPFIGFDSNDGLFYDRTLDQFQGVISGSARFLHDTAGWRTNRYYGNQGNTAWTSARFTLSAGWGSSAFIQNLSATDSRGRFQVVSLGTGQTANPTITITFADGAYATTPIVLVSQHDGSRVEPILVHNITTTGFSITWFSTPISNEGYTFSFLVMG